MFRPIGYDAMNTYIYSFFFQGKDITKKRPFGISVKRNNTILAFHKLRKYHAGDYVCEAVVDYGVPIHSNTLTIPYVKEVSVHTLASYNVY